MNELQQQDLFISPSAIDKLAELLGTLEEDAQGIRVYAAPGGCSGMSFGMTFADRIDDNDLVAEHGDVRLIVDADTIGHLRGAEIDFIDHGDGNTAFVFNNIPQPSGGGCSSGGCSGGGCG